VVELPAPSSIDKPVLTATALDRLSRCSFQGLAFHRWKLRDLREPEAELWPDVRGNILHEAVQRLLESRDAEGNFTVTPAEALDRAWASKPPYGLLRSPRIESYARSRMLDVLGIFCAKERDYFTRAGARSVSLENLKLRLDYPEFAVVGTPDRIDEGVDGLFVIDYKTSSVNPDGAEMLERGYRLQLPFYALAARAQLKKPVVGVQFVELTRSGSRSRGMFFKAFNGKEPGKFTNARSNVKSLLSIEPDEAWSRMDDAIRAQAADWLAGRFAAQPKVEPRAKECDHCMLSDLCGFKRLGAFREET
jgi:ATP-dependent helicase/DNAse subunit B